MRPAARRERRPPGLLTRLEQPGSPEWLRDIYWNELEDALQRRFSFRNYWSNASTADRQDLVELLERQPHQRVEELFDGERPIPMSSAEGRNEADLNRELEERFNALFEAELQADDLHGE